MKYTDEVRHDASTSVLCENDRFQLFVVLKDNFGNLNGDVVSFQSKLDEIVLDISVGIFKVKPRAAYAPMVLFCILESREHQIGVIQTARHTVHKTLLDGVWEELVSKCKRHDAFSNYQPEQLTLYICQSDVSEVGWVISFATLKEKDHHGNGPQTRVQTGGQYAIDDFQKQVKCCGTFFVDHISISILSRC